MTCINKYYFGCGCDTPTSEDCQGSLGDDCCEILINKMDKLLCRMDKMENKLCKCLGCECEEGGGGDGGDGEEKPGKAEITLLGGAAADQFLDLMPTADGYVVCGSTTSAGAGGSDGLLVKFNKSLGLVSKTTIGGAKDESLRALAHAGDEGCIAVGDTNSVGQGMHDALVLGISKDMDVTHQRLLGSAYIEQFFAVAATPSEFTGSARYVAAGNTSTNTQGYYGALIVSYDKDYNVLKKVRVGGASGVDNFCDVVATESGIVAVGQINNTSTAGSFDGLIVSFDNDLNVTKKILIGGALDDRLTSIVKTADGYVVSGHTNSVGFGSYDALVLTLDENFNIIKRVILGGSGSDTIPYSSLAVTPNGNYVLTGTTGSAGAGGTDAMLVVLDKDLNIIKQLVFGGSGVDTSAAVVANADDSYTIVGSTASAGAGNADAFIATFSGKFSDIAGHLPKYPALKIDTNPGLQTKSSFSFTVNNTAALVVTINPGLVAATTNLTIKADPASLLVDANAVVVV